MNAETTWIRKRHGFVELEPKCGQIIEIAVFIRSLVYRWLQEFSAPLTAIVNSKNPGAETLDTSFRLSSIDGY